MNFNAVLFDYGDTLSGGASWIDPLIRQLYQSGYRLGIVSNSNRYGDAAWLREHVAAKGWSRYFEVIIGSGGMLSSNTKDLTLRSYASNGCHKPNHDIYKRAVDFLGVPASRILFVGDNLDADVIGPLEFGMSSLSVNSSEDYSAELWDVLEDKPCLRSNVLTVYAFDVYSSILTIQLKHLTEPLKKGDELIAGLRRFIVEDWDVQHTKKDILDKNHSQIIKIKVVPCI